MRVSHNYNLCENLLMINFCVTRRSRVIVITYLLTHSLTHSALALTWLMWPWWVMILIEDLTDVALAIGILMKMMKMMMMMKMMKMMKKTWLMWPWWMMIPIEDLTDVTLAIEDTASVKSSIGIITHQGHISQVFFIMSIIFISILNC